MISIADRIDHTLLKSEATRPQLHQLVAEAIEHRFAAVCVNGCFVADVAKALHGTGVKTCAVVGFPLGASKGTVKTIEATAAAKDGADEVDFVAHLPPLLACQTEVSKFQFIEIVKAVRSVNPRIVIKVIIESALMLSAESAAQGEERIESACQAARESGCDFVKTSTGFHPSGGASCLAVQLMKKHSGGLYVKASGGIRTYDQAMQLLDAGADRLGCSNSTVLIDEVNDQVT